MLAEGEGKPIREFREDTGEVVVAGEQKRADTALYADQVAQAVRITLAGASVAATASATKRADPARQCVVTTTYTPQTEVAEWWKMYSLFPD